MNKPVTLFFLILISNFTMAEEETQSTPDIEIPTTHIEVHVGRPDAVPKPELLPEDMTPAEEPAKPTDPLEALQHEVQTLRDEIHMLQSTLDLMINQIMSDLREDNRVLRKEVQRLTEMQDSYGLPDMSVIPRPGMEIIADALEQPLWQEEEIIPEEEQYTEEPFDFTPLHQWGRTPETAAELGDDTSSLLGLVGVVPRNSRPEDIQNLGRELRNEYEGYDNINIEVFDDTTAAEQFIETQIDDPARRVLSISKHRSEGRDVILYLKNGKAQEISREATPGFPIPTEN
jgi:hypothetical protein